MKRIISNLLLTLTLTACNVPATPVDVAQSFDQEPEPYIAVFRPGTQGQGTRIASKLLNAFTVPARAVPGLRNNPNVLYIEPVRIMTVDSWGIDRIDQRQLPLDGNATAPNRGSGPVYIVDTGIDYSHPEFGGRALFGWDSEGGDGSDCHSHGTHVAGTATGATMGIARNANPVSVKVFPGCTGSTPTDVIIQGLDWIATQTVGPVNMSIGGPFSKAFNDATNELVALGYPVAVAAGNNGGDACTTSPSSAINALTVGATSDKDTRPSWSNWGDCVDLFAPGQTIQSSVPGGGYEFKSGTSMASPHVAGVLALGFHSDSLKSWSTKNVVFNANSENAHMLYLYPEHDPDLGDPPEPPAPDPLVPATFVREWVEKQHGGILIRWGTVFPQGAAGIVYFAQHCPGGVNCTDWFEFWRTTEAKPGEAKKGEHGERAEPGAWWFYAYHFDANGDVFGPRWPGEDLRIGFVVRR